jgi:hypothetical protein
MMINRNLLPSEGVRLLECGVCGEDAGDVLCTRLPVERRLQNALKRAPLLPQKFSHAYRGLYIGKYPRGRGISANVIWVKKYEKWNRKRGKM